MNATIKYQTNGDFTFNLLDMIGQLPPEDKLVLVEHLSCEAEVIEFVVDQIVDTYTVNGYHGMKFHTAQHTVSGLDDAIRKVAKASSIVAKKEIERLEDALKKSEQRYYDLLWER